MSRGLTWTPSTFPVLLRAAGDFKPQLFRVAGIVSGPFGIFRGDKSGPDRGGGAPRFSLVLVASGGFLCTYARQIDCKVVAEELAPLEVNWCASEGQGVTGPGIATARALLKCCERRYKL